VTRTWIFSTRGGGCWHVAGEPKDHARCAPRRKLTRVELHEGERAPVRWNAYTCQRCLALIEKGKA
jgi:hypothetical protein